jgi:hypothetical protein
MITPRPENPVYVGGRPPHIDGASIGESAHVEQRLERMGLIDGLDARHVEQRRQAGERSAHRGDRARLRVELDAERREILRADVTAQHERHGRIG